MDAQLATLQSGRDRRNAIGAVGRPASDLGSVYHAFVPKRTKRPGRNQGCLGARPGLAATLALFSVARQGAR